MQNKSFKVAATFVLFFFITTPLSALAAPLGLGSGYGAGFGGQPGVSNDFTQGALFGSLFNNGNQGGLGGPNQGGGAQFGQGLSLAGALTGNIGLMIVGQLMSMLGGLAGGATPQQGAVDEQYVGQGQRFGSGNGASYGAYDPYYTTPTSPSTDSGQAALACASSLFILKDTTATPNMTKPYPDKMSVLKDGCVLAVNADTAPHNIEVKKQGQAVVSNNEAIAASSSHIFRFSAKNTYTLCVDSSSSACTTVTVQ